jgi:hypothetical protein
MGHTAPAWLEITAAIIGFAGMVAFVVWTVVLWVVRPRLPHSDTEPRLAPRFDEDLVLQLTGPVRRVTREIVAPSAHQPAAHRPEWRVQAGPWSPDATAVRFPITGQAVRPTGARGSGRPGHRDRRAFDDASPRRSNERRGPLE